MKTLSVDHFKSELIKRVARVENKVVSDIGDLAIKITKEKMAQQESLGRPSKLGEVVRNQPKTLSGRATKNNLSKKIIPTNDGVYLDLYDKSPRAYYKYEYTGRRGSGNKVYVMSYNALQQGRNEDGTLKNGRTGLGYGLYNAIKQSKNIIETSINNNLKKF